MSQLPGLPASGWIWQTGGTSRRSGGRRVRLGLGFSHPSLLDCGLAASVPFTLWSQLGSGALLGHSSHHFPEQWRLPWSFPCCSPGAPHSLLVSLSHLSPLFNSLWLYLQLGPLFSAKMLLMRHQVSSRLEGGTES